MLQEQEEERNHAGFRANPVPMSTYHHKPIVPEPRENLVDPFSPELQSKERSKQRQEFDEYARREREAAEARAREIEALRLAEEEEDLRQRRSLPVSEGGLIPTAEPVNAVFWNEKE